MDKIEKVFEKIALSPELLFRASAAAEKAAKEYSKAVKTLVGMKKFKEAVPFAEKAIKKHDQTIDFSIEGLMRDLDRSLFSKETIKQIDDMLPFGGAERRLELTKDFIRQNTRSMMGHSKQKEVDSLQKLIDKYK